MGVKKATKFTTPCGSDNPSRLILEKVALPTRGHICCVVPENPGGVSWTNNPSFPLKASVSEPEGEAWVAMSL